MTSSFTDLLPLATFTESIIKVWQFLHAGGVFMIFIGLCSIIAVAIVVQKISALRSRTVLPEDLVDLLRDLHAGRRVSPDALRTALSDGQSPLARISRAALLEPHASKDEALQSAQAIAREEIVHLERGVGLLEALIAAGPLLGLLGAVSGLVSVFSNFTTASDTADNASLAAGIAEALHTTIAGLVVAIPSTFAHSFFSRKIEKLAARMEVLVVQALSACYAHRPDATPTPAIYRASGISN